MLERGRGHVVTRPCAQCGAPFTVAASEVRISRTCSRECRAAYSHVYQEQSFVTKAIARNEARRRARVAAHERQQ